MSAPEPLSNGRRAAGERDLDAAGERDLGAADDRRAAGDLDLGADVADAVEQLAARDDRGPGGRFARGSQLRLRHGARSEALLALLAPAKAALVERVRADLALDAGAPATLDALADSFAEASLLRRALFARLAESGGVVTGKGRVRAALRAYLLVSDRELRLASTLGLARRSRPVDPLDAVRRAVEEAQREPVEEPEPEPAGVEEAEP